MEKGLHKVIIERVEELIEDNGQSLPQLALLYEEGSFYYSPLDYSLVLCHCPMIKKMAVLFLYIVDIDH
jgi:hypothetical protein